MRSQKILFHLSFLSFIEGAVPELSGRWLLELWNVKDGYGASFQQVERIFIVVINCYVSRIHTYQELLTSFVQQNG